MARIAGLGHVGLYVQDLDREKEFYVGVLGMEIADELPDQRIVFLSSDPKREHHELLLAQTDDVDHLNNAAIQQVSFRVEELADLVEFHELLQQRADIQIEMTVTHGNAVGVYFFDPQGVRCEVYWNTGIWAKQPFLSDVDLTSLPVEELRESLLSFARAHADTGFVDAHYRQDGYLDLV